MSGAAVTSRLLVLFVLAAALPAAAQPIQRSQPESARPVAAAAQVDDPAPAAKSVPAADGLGAARVTAALGIVIVVIIALRWIGQRLMGGVAGAGGTRVVQVLSRCMVSPRQQLMVVRVGRRLLVVANSGGQMNPLCEISDPEEAAALIGQIQAEKGESVSGSFASLFGRAKQGFASEERADAAPVEPRDEQEQPPAAMQQELRGLSEKVRLLARQFGSS